MITLRPHQVNDINAAKKLRLNPLIKFILHVLPTGSGKSLTLASIAQEDYQANRRCVIFAHKDVLISQLSEALCKVGVPHSFICANKKSVTDITNRNLREYGDSYYNELSPIVLSSNPTFAARLDSGLISQNFLDGTYRWIQDEAHHAIKTSKTWGRCLSAFPNAIGDGFTATPKRGDKRGLGRWADGFFDDMTCVTSMWDLIRTGMLSPYKVFVPPVKFDRNSIKVNSSNGEFVNSDAAKKVDKKEITGDAVEHYLKICPGQPVITFCANIRHARNVAKEFNSRGIPSAAISSKMPIEERDRIMADFEAHRILNLVNVDLLGEGYDCPAVVAVIMLRPTQSYALFKQQFGRMLRLFEGKEYGILLDHVGNVNYMRTTFGIDNLHDDPEWTLDRESKRAKNDDGTKIDPFITCPNEMCGFQYKRSEHKCCPECGYVETKAEREAVVAEIQKREGHLVELTSDVINQLLAERQRVMIDPKDLNSHQLPANRIARQATLNNHALRLHAQTLLRLEIQTWCCTKALFTGWSKELVTNEFNRVFGVNILKAQSLSARESDELRERIVEYGKAKRV